MMTRRLLLLGGAGVALLSARGARAGWMVGKSEVSLSLSGTPVLTGTVGVPYAGFTMTASGGFPPYVYGKVSGPSWLSVGASTGAVTGTPDAPGDTATTLNVTDSLSNQVPLGPFTISVQTSNQPVVADQTIDFGALTLANAGGAAPVNTGGTITSASITGGTLSGGDWVIASDGTLTKTTNTTSSGTLVISVSNASGSDTATITINAIANAYSVVPDPSGSETQYKAALTAIGSGGGKKVLFRAGTNKVPTDNGANCNRSFSATVTVESHDHVNMVIFLGTQTGATRTAMRNPNNVTFSYIDFYSIFDPDYHNSNAVGFALVGTVDGLIFDHCILRGNTFSSLIGFVKSNGVTVALDNLQTQCPHFLGLIGKDGTTAISGGGLTISNCVIHDAARLLNIATGQPITVTLNEFYNFRVDCTVFSHTTSFIYTWNRNHSPYAYVSDSDHGDFCQLNNENFNSSGIQIYGNLMLASRDDGLANIKHEFQGIFLQPNAGFTCEASIYGNAYVGMSVHGVRVYNGQNCVVRGNSMATSQDYAWIKVPQIQLEARSGESCNNNNISDNVSLANGITVDSGGSVGTGNTIANNYVADPSSNYATAFALSSGAFAPTTLTQLQSIYTVKSGGPLDTASPKIGALGTYVDFNAHTTSFPWGP